VVICLERGEDLPIAQLMPLPLTVSCSSKIQTGFTFLVPTHPGRPGQSAVKRVSLSLSISMGKEERGRTTMEQGRQLPNYCFTSQVRLP